MLYFVSEKKAAKNATFPRKNPRDLTAGESYAGYTRSLIQGSSACFVLLLAKLDSLRSHNTTGRYYANLLLELWLVTFHLPPPPQRPRLAV